MRREMKQIIFLWAMLFAPSLYAATLTANTVPYVCQGGTTPQLCNSNITSTAVTGNVLISTGNVGIGTWSASNSVGGMSLVAIATPSAVSSVTFSGLSPGVRYVLETDLIQNTSNGTQSFNINSDSGNNYLRNQVSWGNGSVAVNSLTDNAIYVPGSTITAGTASKSELKFTTVPGVNSSVQILANGCLQRASSVGVPYCGSWYYYYTGTSNLSTITLSTSPGTMTGTVSLYSLN